MKTPLAIRTPEALSEDVLDLFLDEAERALCEVEIRADEPGSHELEFPDLGPFRLALPEQIEAHPGLVYELELIGDRLRTMGAAAATQLIELYPHILDIVRLSLELFVRLYPSAADYEPDHARRLGLDPRTEESSQWAETYAAYLSLREQLRRRLS